MVSIQDISMRARWDVATRILTYMPFLFLKEISRDENGRERISRVFRAIAEEMRRIADEFGMPREDAAGLVQTLGTMSVALFGPEFKTPLIEGDAEETIIRFTACPMCTLAREKGLKEEDAGVLCAAYVSAVIEALNPAYRIVTNDSMCREKLFCEMVILKKEPGA